MQAEEVKKQLSAHMQVHVYCRLGGGDGDGIGQDSAGVGSIGVVGVPNGSNDADLGDAYLAEQGLVRIRMLRSDLEEGCAYIFQRALQPITRLLESTNMRTSDIDDIVCVGGSTRIPHIKALLHDYFNQTAYDSIDPDITVAYGAASIID